MSDSIVSVVSWKRRGALIWGGIMIPLFLHLSMFNATIQQRVISAGLCFLFATLLSTQMRGIDDLYSFSCHSFCHLHLPSQSLTFLSICARLSLSAVLSDSFARSSRCSAQTFSSTFGSLGRRLCRVISVCYGVRLPISILLPHKLRDVGDVPIDSTCGCTSFSSPCNGV